MTHKTCVVNVEHFIGILVKIYLLCIYYRYVLFAILIDGLKMVRVTQLLSSRACGQ